MKYRRDRRFATTEISSHTEKVPFRKDIRVMNVERILNANTRCDFNEMYTSYTILHLAKRCLALLLICCCYFMKLSLFISFLLISLHTSRRMKANLSDEIFQIGSRDLLSNVVILDACFSLVRVQTRNSQWIEWQEL